MEIMRDCSTGQNGVPASAGTKSVFNVDTKKQLYMGPEAVSSHLQFSFMWHFVQLLWQKNSARKGFQWIFAQGWDQGDFPKLSIPDEF